ncbi:phosphotransferase [Brachybacterium sp. EF45031]|uniref:phosphotransferase n=1 Tax=Brachybacterium sillae TaxID=2810536 RepID=UPI00217E42A5|nr:phosphotransferase [Brachybacterium sillae]MCS6712453.1 phosphotransferase [Brachybacterium sillae]
MHRNPYALAALATAAVPGLRPTRTAALPSPMEDVSVAGVVGQDGTRVMVTAPETAAAGALLERDVRLVDALQGTHLAPLVPAVLGTARLPEGGRAVITETPSGRPLTWDDLADDVPLARSLGAALARIHAVPVYAVEAGGVETYSAQALRARHHDHVRRAHEAGEIPAAVHQRWEALLEDDGLWDFVPAFVHGALAEESVLVEQGRVSGILAWWDATVGDPAQDLAWLVPSLTPERFDDLVSAYRDALPTPPHPRLLERAQAVGELAVVDWLLHGLDQDDPEVIEDARGMLADLDADIAALAREDAEAEFASLDQEVDSQRDQDGEPISRPRPGAAPAPDATDAL